MKTNPYRNHSVTAAVAAAVVTTVLVSSLVASFEPAQLIRFERDAAGDLIALERRIPADVFQA